MSRALDDVIVLDLTRQFCSALSGAFLADFGARVIRLDLLPAAAGAKGGDGKWNHEADLIHRNKESLALDPYTERGAELLKEVVAKADVIITDWQRDELVALGLDYASVAKLRGDIVFGRLSGFGPVGPDADLPPIDELAAARTGMMPILPQPGQPPVYSGSGAMHAAVMLAFGVVTALVHRVDSGEGQEVDVSLFGANMYGAALDIQAFLAIGKGDRLLPAGRPELLSYVPHAPEQEVNGRIVSIVNGVADTGRYHVVSLSLGKREGIEVGHVLSLHRNRGKAIYREDDVGAPQPFQLPEQRYGLLFVFRVFERISYGLVMESVGPVSVADSVRKP